MDINDEIATCQIGQPHLGFTMTAMVDDDGILDGEAKIYDPSGQLCAKFYYEEGEETGKCELYYDSGELYFDGYLEKGYRVEEVLNILNMVKNCLMAFIRTVKEISISKETKRNESIGMKLMLLAKSYVYVKRTIKDKTMELVILSTMDIFKQSVFGRMARKLVYGTNLRVIK